MSQYIDMHCDTLMLTYFRDRSLQSMRNMDGACMVDFDRMKQGGALAQFFAIFLPPARSFEKRNMPITSDERYIEALVEIFEREVSENGDLIAKATSAEDICTNGAAGKISAVLSMEDGRAVDGKMEKLDKYYSMGVRALSLTWNQYNCFGAPNSKNPTIMRDGLTAFGREAVLHMQEIGMLIDVSHLSDGGFYDVASLCKDPFVATHSNCRALSPHPRNLTDEMIRILADHGGVMGLNFGPEFLNNDITSVESKVEDMVAMVKHAVQVGGIGVVGIGGDFDGIHGKMEISGSHEMPKLEDGLRKAGFSDDDIDLIYQGNVLRVMRTALK